MKKQRPNLTLRYIGEASFIPTNFWNKSYTFARGKDVQNCPHELLEMLIESYPGEIEVVGVDNEDDEIIETNLDESQPEIRTISRRGRRPRL